MVCSETGAVCTSNIVGGIDGSCPPGEICCTNAATCSDSGLSCSANRDAKGECPVGKICCDKGAMCKFFDACAEQECLGHQAIWHRNRFCNEGGFAQVDCIPWSCRFAEESCDVSHTETGCSNPFCCVEVCGFDSFCCDVAWDDQCVQWMDSSCANSSSIDECIDAAPLAINSVTAATNRRATTSVSNPGYCCAPIPGLPGSPPLGFSRGIRGIWFKFVAPESSVRIHTCDSDPPASDSLLAIHRVENADTTESSCDSLVMIACSNNATTCDTGTLSDLCVDGLTPGETYYVQLAAQSEEFVGVYRLSVESPCPEQGPLPSCAPVELTWIDPPLNTVDARQPFDPNDPGSVPTINGVTVLAPAKLDDLCCWDICQTGDESNWIDHIDDLGGNIYRVEFGEEGP